MNHPPLAAGIIVPGRGEGKDHECSAHQSPPATGQGWNDGVIDLDHPAPIVGCAAPTDAASVPLQLWQAAPRTT
jgi:hypothetical protein